MLRAASRQFTKPRWQRKPRPNDSNTVNTTYPNNVGPAFASYGQAIATLLGATYVESNWQPCCVRRVARCCELKIELVRMPGRNIVTQSQSRPQSLRYLCPAERENEDLWERPFELGISLAINRACAVSSQVDKQQFCSQISNSKPRVMDVQALGTIASSGNMAYKTPGKSLLRHTNQQHIWRYSNFSFVSNRNDLFGVYLRENLSSIFYTVK